MYPKPCPAGYFCEEGDNSNPNAVVNYPQPCPKGTYGAKIELTQESECTKCDPGFFCSEPGSASPTGLCDAGFVCVVGSDTPRPDGSDTSMGEPCPAGGYCEAGSFKPQLCQSGYYNPYTGKQTIFDCLECPPGQWCGGTMSSTTSGNCIDGYYCLKGSPVEDQYPAPPGTYSSSVTEWKETN